MVSFVFAVQTAIFTFCYFRSMHYHKMSEDLSLSFMERKQHKDTSDTYVNVCAGLTVFAVIFMFVAANGGF